VGERAVRERLVKQAKEAAGGRFPQGFLLDMLKTYIADSQSPLIREIVIADPGQARFGQNH
jgi:hypothetical protein